MGKRPQNSLEDSAQRQFGRVKDRERGNAKIGFAVLALPGGIGVRAGPACWAAASPPSDAPGIVRVDHRAVGTDRLDGASPTKRREEIHDVLIGHRVHVVCREVAGERA